jgi:hypothetical protein
MTGVMSDSAATPTGSGNGGLSTSEVIAIVAVVAAVLIAAAVFVVRRRHRAR